MCGIFMQTTGYSNGFIQREIDCIKANAFINGFRGIDSTGLVSIRNNHKEYDIVKSLGSIIYLIGTKEFDAWQDLVLKHGQVVVGHGRAATRGTVNLENAHPFDEKNEENTIVLVHNGTLLDHQTLPDFHKFTNDSRWLTSQILSAGEEEVLSRLNGPIASIWWNLKDQALYFYRNSERPLHYARTKAGELIVNSEPQALMWLNYKFNLGFGFEHIKEFKAETLYKLSTQETRDDFEEKVIKRKTFFRPGTEHHHGSTGGAMVWGNSPIKKHKLTEDIKKIFDGEYKRVKFDWSKGTKEIITKNGDVMVMQERSDEEFLLELELSEQFKDMICKRYSYNRDKHGNPKGLTMIYVQYADLLDQPDNDCPNYEADNEEGWDEEMHGIWTPASAGPKHNNRTFTSQEILSVDVQPKAGRVVKFSTLDGASRKQVYNKGLCEEHAPKFLEIYHNSVGGTYKKGDKVIIETFDYEDMKGNSPAEQDSRYFKVTGGLIIPDNPSLSTVDAYYYEYGRTAKECAEIGMFVGEINWISLATKTEFEKNGAKILFLLRNVKPVSDLSTAEVKDIHAQRAVSFKDAVKAFHQKRQAHAALLRKAQANWNGIQ